MWPVARCVSEYYAKPARTTMGRTHAGSSILRRDVVLREQWILIYACDLAGERTG